jgi:hypothetical protein
MSEKRELKLVRVVKRESVEVRTRAEFTLLYELIQRNPERAAEFLRRLGYSLVKAA